MASLLFLLITAAFAGIQFNRLTISYTTITLAFILACFLLFHHVDFGSLNIDL